ncbi:plasmid mobilization protein [Campylobacter sp. RM16192]|uniref:plasmid mobilization protein n=1 Tax=Campylobacter sp. RM16192 TaxID=1660080 RepID=UPI001639D552|nr:hypothetical protein [Campylobacter sp. RM16192]
MYKNINDIKKLFIEGDALSVTENNQENTLLEEDKENKTFQNQKGRPTVDEEDKRTEQIIIYLTKKQKETLKNKAKKNNLSISKYVTIKIFGLE